MDPHEAKLEEEVRLRRAELLEKGESLRRSVVETLDPRSIVKRNPVGGLLTSLGVGLFMGRMLTGRGTRGKNAAAEAPPLNDAPSLVSLVAGMLPGLALRALPKLIGPVFSLFRSQPSSASDDGVSDVPDGHDGHARTSQ